MVKLEFKLDGNGWQPIYWKAVKGTLDHRIQSLTRLWVVRLANEARRNAPIRSGHLRGSITQEIFTRGDFFFREYIGVVGTNVEHAPWVEFGTGIHSDFPGAPRTVIRPRYAKALKIPIGIRTRSVRRLPIGFQGIDLIGRRTLQAVIFRAYQKGQKKQPFLTPLVDKYQDEIVRDFRMAFFDVLPP